MKIFFTLIIVALIIWTTILILISRDVYWAHDNEYSIESIVDKKNFTKMLQEVRNRPQKIMPMVKKYFNNGQPKEEGEPFLEKRIELDLPGDGGKGVILPQNMSTEMKEVYNNGWNLNAFNQYVSDLISVKRTLPDMRDPWCKKSGRYSSDLPVTSIIICFHNEAWSTLLRTIHSVLDGTPEKLIEEIILVDDFSYLAHTQKMLEDYLMNFSKVRIIRTTKREGLIRARLIGSQYAVGSVLTFLDSHCECTEGWLEPLLDRIARDPTTVVCPSIDTIDGETFEYINYGEILQVGGFNWNLNFNWIEIPDREKRRHDHHAEPVWSPTMAGGLFSIDKAFFEKLGTYDPGFDIWGGENLELSFKTWMCGGTLEILPCSHVGHIFRKRSPYTWGTTSNVLLRNLLRLAKVWLDDYAEYFYNSQNYISNINIGDVSERLALRKSLNCKSFDWYLKNIYPELYIPKDILRQGEIRNHQDRRNICLDSDSAENENFKPLAMYGCHKHGGNQFWLLTHLGEIRQNDFCLDSNAGEVFMYCCHLTKGNQEWVFDSASQLIKHVVSMKCLALSEELAVIIEECDHTNKRHIWNIGNDNIR